MKEFHVGVWGESRDCCRWFLLVTEITLVSVAPSNMKETKDPRWRPARYIPHLFSWRIWFKPVSPAGGEGDTAWGTPFQPRVIWVGKESLKRQKEGGDQGEGNASGRCGCMEVVTWRNKRTRRHSVPLEMSNWYQFSVRRMRYDSQPKMLMLFSFSCSTDPGRLSVARSWEEFTLVQGGDNV